MFALKLALIILVCVPMAYISVLLLSKLMDEVLKRNK